MGLGHKFYQQRLDLVNIKYFIKIFHMVEELWPIFANCIQTDTQLHKPTTDKHTGQL